jgi:hypothetical protein
MTPMPRCPMTVPRPAGVEPRVPFAPVQTLSRLVEAQVGLTLAAAGLALALSPLGLAGAVGRRTARSREGLLRQRDPDGASPLAAVPRPRRRSPCRRSRVPCVPP